MQDSIFTQIIRGDIPSHKVYEDDNVLAFLDIYPVQPGHTLVIPKKQVEFVWDLDDDDYVILMAASKKIALHLRTALNVPYVGVQVMGTDVPHAHIHLIPFTTAEEYRNVPDVSKEPDHQKIAVLAKTLRF